MIQIKSVKVALGNKEHVKEGKSESRFNSDSSHSDRRQSVQ